jgi:hypothetical protein
VWIADTIRANTMARFVFSGFHFRRFAMRVSRACPIFSLLCLCFAAGVALAADADEKGRDANAAVPSQPGA